MSLPTCRLWTAFIWEDESIATGVCAGCRSPQPTQVITKQQMTTEYAHTRNEPPCDLVKISAPEIAVRVLLNAIGEDPDREGLKDTPRRVVKALHEMCDGYTVDVDELMTTFTSTANEMVVVRDLAFASLCEHHMLPFTGVASMAYIPSGKILGLSKFGRILDAFSRRLQVQERLTDEICDHINKHLQPMGCGVRLRGFHSCMACRGVRKTGEMVTTALRGAFKDDPAARAEFLQATGG